MRVTCIRYHNTTGVPKEETHTVSLKYHETLASWWVYLSPGVTGYESARAKHILNESRWNNGGWSACAGTKGSWDRLVVPPESMEKIRDVLRMLPINWETENE